MTYKRDEHTDTHQGRSDDGYNPMNFVLRSPAIDEKRRWDEEGPRDHWRQAIFGLLYSVFLGEVLEESIGGRAQHEQSNHGSDPNAKIREADATL